MKGLSKQRRSISRVLTHCRRNEITRIIVLEDPLWDKDLSGDVKEEEEKEEERCDASKHKRWLMRL